MKKKEIKGNYGNENIKLFIQKSINFSNFVTIFIHGLYGIFNENDIDDKVYLLSKKLIEKNISNTLCYESSRDFSFDRSLPFDQRQKAFKEKTFKQELDDLKNVINYVIGNSKSLFGIEKKDLILNIHGNSIGGTLILMLTEYFLYIKKISLCGTGCGRGTSNRPIQSTIPDELILLNSISKYSEKLFLLQGDKDDVVPLGSGVKILNHAVNAKTFYQKITGINHNFSKINGLETKEADNIFINEILDFFENK